MDEPVEPVEADSGQQISDFDSESCQESPEPDPTTDVSLAETPSAYMDTRWRNVTSLATHACQQCLLVITLPGLSVYALFLEVGP